MHKITNNLACIPNDCLIPIPPFLRNSYYNQLNTKTDSFKFSFFFPLNNQAMELNPPLNSPTIITLIFAQHMQIWKCMMQYTWCWIITTGMQPYRCTGIFIVTIFVDVSAWEANSVSILVHLIFDLWDALCCNFVILLLELAPYLSCMFHCTYTINTK